MYISMEIIQTSPAATRVILAYTEERWVEVTFLRSGKRRVEVGLDGPASERSFEGCHNEAAASLITGILLGKVDPVAFLEGVAV